MPGPKDQVNDTGQVIRANPRSEKALTNEPLYQGEPVLAVAAVDELTAAEAIEKIKIQWEPLPFSVDPVASLLPGAMNPRVEGNVWMRPVAEPGQPPPTPGSDRREMDRRRRPRNTRPAGCRWASTPILSGSSATSRQDSRRRRSSSTKRSLRRTSAISASRARTSMAFWQNGKLHIHLSTQSTVQTVMSVVRWLDLKPENIVLVTEYCGGGYGAKGTGSVTDIIPALLSKKLGGAPVMMRISREEEHAIGRARPAMHGRMKVGFTKEGRITALDMFTVVEGGPYGPGGDGNTASRFASLMFQPETMRWRGITAITNTPPRGAQSQPGGMQGIVLMEPVVAKAARKLGIDQVEIRKINAPEGKAKFGPGQSRRASGVLRPAAS